jgi:hypothetical protein
MTTKAKKPQFFLNFYRQIVISFVILTIVLIGVIVFFSLVQAKIEVTPRKTLANVEFLVDVGSGGVGEVINGRLEERVIEKEEQIEATGKKTITTERATGTVTLINTTNFDQPLVATTRLLSSEGVLFRLKNRVVIPAQGRITAEVYADKPGEEGNIGPSRFIIPGLPEAKQKLIWAESDKPMIGGTREVRIVSAMDLTQAKLYILKKIEEETLAKYKEEIKEEFSDALIKILSSEVTTLAKEGEERQTFGVKATAKVALVAFDRQQLERIARTHLLLSLPPDKELLSFEGDKALVLKLDNFDFNASKATLRVYVDGETILKKNSPIFNVEKLAGMGVEEAKKYLESFEGVEKVKITIFPSWLKNIPTLKDHIGIIIIK